MSIIVNRRAIARGAAWSAPVIAIGAASPTLAASGVTVTTLSLPVGYVGEAYSAPLVAGSSGTYTWTLSGGSLAPGTSVNPNGTILGTPTSIGGFSPVVTATASGGGSGSATLTQVIGVNRANAASEMLAQINARRAGIGLAPLTSTADLASKATAWADHLAATESVLVHQDPLPAGVNGENLSATCSDTVPKDNATVTGGQLVNGWLTEPHSYAEWSALNATDPDKAQEMYSGVMPDPNHPGKFIKSTTYPKASGHRINLENPNFKSVGLSLALSDAGSACTPSTKYGYYGAAEFAM